MSYQSKDELILGQQLRVQELVVRFADTQLYTQAVAGTVVVDLQETPSAIVSATFHDNSVPGVVMIAASGISISSESASCVLGATFAANDVLVLKYIISE